MPANLPHPAAPTDGPRHVALIMDGNGRWAEARGLPRAMGHREGVQALKRTVQAAPALGITCLTVFGFSTENWRRPAEEVSDLMGLVRSYVASDLKRLEREGVKVRVLGRRTGLPADIAAIIDRAEATTAHNDKFILQVAFNYGGRADIVDAAQRHIDLVMAGKARGPLDEDALGQGLSTAGAPPLDVRVGAQGDPPGADVELIGAASARRGVQTLVGRAAPVELPAVGSRLRRAGLSERALARLRPRRPGGRGRTIP